MKKINRLQFIRRSAGASFGALIVPGTLLGIDGLTNYSTPDGYSPEETDLRVDIQWEKRMAACDIVWNSIPQNMTEAPHLGNGRIGSMIWVEENELRLHVFRADVHDHADESFGWTAYSRPRYRIGYFSRKFSGDIVGCDLRLEMYTAELSGSITTEKGKVIIRHLVHYHDDTIYTNLVCQGDEQPAEWTWHPYEAKGTRGGSPGEERYGQVYAPYKVLENPIHTTRKEEGILTGVQDLTAGGQYATAWKELNFKNKSTVLLVTIQNSYPDRSATTMAANLVRATEKEVLVSQKDWIKKHHDWWQQFYPQSFVDFPDPAGVAFYWNNVYRLACCTRPDAQYIDTAGMWNSGGPWPYSTHDFNTQTAHFPVYTANRLELGEALIRNLTANQHVLIDNVVPEEWRDDSAYLSLSTAFDLKGKRDEDGRYSEMFGCLPWLLNNCWLHYRYSMDKGILKDTVFPLLRRSINLYRHILYTGKDGKLHLPPTFSPELGKVADSTFDLALIRWGCGKLIEICGILGINDPLIPEWRRITDSLVDYQRDEKGYMLGEGESAPADHQHMSHLMMIYPLYLENLDTTKDIGLLERSVRNFQPSSLAKMGASQSGPAAAALGLGNLAHQRMNEILYRESPDEKLGRNGIYYLSTPCIETSLSYNTCVQDMLLQSWGNTIRVFPALPDAWDTVAFHNLRAEGGFLISARRIRGVTVFVRIRSLAGEPCVVSPAMSGQVNVFAKRKVELVELDSDCYRIDLQKSEEVFLYQGDSKPEFFIG